mgnify:CR=1 FL=1
MSQETDSTSLLNEKQTDPSFLAGVLSDKQIKDLSLQKEMIYPFISESQRYDKNKKGVLSYGLSCGGYDVRAAPIFKIMKDDVNALPLDDVLDVKSSGIERYFRDTQCDTLDIPPRGFVLTHTIEKFNIPEDVMAVCYTKSTYARCGLSLATTIIEPGQTGHIVLEIYNHTNYKIRFYANEGCAQFVFMKMSTPPDVPYNRRHGGGGKYMGQEGIVLPHAK